MSEGHAGYRLILLAIIIAANGFFAASETALLSTRKSRLKQLAEGGNVGAQAALNLLAQPERLLSVVQFGVTLASLGLGWAGEETIFNILFGAMSFAVNDATRRLSSRACVRTVVRTDELRPCGAGRGSA